MLYMILSDPPIFFGYGSLSKNVQQTKTLSLIYLTNYKFFFKSDAAGFQFNGDCWAFSSKAKNYQEEIYCSTSSKSLRSNTVLIRKTNKQPKLFNTTYNDSVFETKSGCHDS